MELRFEMDPLSSFPPPNPHFLPFFDDTLSDRSSVDLVRPHPSRPLLEVDGASDAIDPVRTWTANDGG